MKYLSVCSITLLLSGNVFAIDSADVLDHYADLAQAMYGDSHTTAVSLQHSISQLIAKPTEENLEAARNAWIRARHPYQQTEAYRFGNTIVDDWEGKVNAWPLDEGLIDYVDSSYGDESDENDLYTANIIANDVLTLSSGQIDIKTINKTLLGKLHEADEVEANVTTGYHAIEFLLWGQDLNGNGPGAGQRPASDFDPRQCTHGHCERRAAYLKAVTALLVADLQWMLDQWGAEGMARKAITQGDTQTNLATILTGMGSLSYGELAGERMKLGLMLHDPEEEHDCFSDNTHWSHYNDALGIYNVYTGSYKRVDGTLLLGPSLSDLVAEKDLAADRALRAQLDTTLEKMQAIVNAANQGQAYDQLIAEGNVEGNHLVKAAVDALVAQTKGIEKAVDVLGLSAIAFEGSDSLDAPEKIEVE